MRQAPREHLEWATNKAVSSLFKTDLRLQVIRQSRELRVGTLNHIDYTVSCFELAASLGYPPNEVASAVAEGLLDRARLQSLPHRTRIESIGGYINFELDPKYLRAVGADVVRWLARPRSGELTKHKIVIVVAGFTTDELARLNPVYPLIRQIYEALGCTVDAECLIHDFSEEAADMASQELLSTNSTLENFRAGLSKDLRAAKARQHMRLVIADSTLGRGLGLEDKAYLETIRERYKLTWEQVSTSQGLVFERGIYESAIAPLAAEWIASAGKEGDSIVRDNTTFAAYYSDKDPECVTPLRSANGFLYQASYIFYLLTKRKSVREVGGGPLVITSFKFSKIFRKYIENLKLQHHADSFFIVGVDSPPDLNVVLSIQSSLKDIRQALIRSGTLRKLEGARERQLILSASEFPTEIVDKLMLGHPDAALQRLLALLQLIRD